MQGIKWVIQNHKGGADKHKGIEETAVKSQIVKSSAEEPENKKSETKVPGVVPKIIMDLLQGMSQKIVFLPAFLLLNSKARHQDKATQLYSAI